MKTLLKLTSLWLIVSIFLFACNICKTKEVKQPETTEMPQVGIDNNSKVDSLKNVLNHRRLKKNK